MVNADRDKSEQPGHYGDAIQSLVSMAQNDGKHVRQIAELRAELETYKRGGKTLGQTIEWQCRAALDATGLHHLIGEDGDGDWGLVWEHLAELRPRAEAAERALAEERAKVAEVARLHAPKPSAWADDYPNLQDLCHECGEYSPCLTLAALAGPEPETSD